MQPQQLADDGNHSAAGAPPAAAPAAELPFAFRVGLWACLRAHVVGLLLSVVTLGLYSPWAKLRRVQYLYGNTSVMGSHLDFDARPMAILVSRLIVVAAIALATLADYAYPFLVGVLGFGTAVLAVVFPLALIRVRAFYARHTLLRGMRFRYACRYAPMAACIALTYAPIIAIVLIFVDYPSPPSGGVEASVLHQVTGLGWIPYLALYLAVAWPALKRWQHHLLLSRLSFGKLKLRLAAGTGAYYRAYAENMLTAALLLTVITAASVGFTAQDLFLQTEFDFTAGTTIARSLLPPIAVFAFVVYSLQARKLFWSSIELSDGSRIASSMTLRGLLGVYLANALTIVLSLGLLWPMATARKWRYVASHIALVPGSMLGAVAASQGEAVSAIGEEGVEMLGFDFDAGVI